VFWLRLAPRLVAVLATQLIGASSLILAIGGTAQAVNIEWVAVGDPGNAADNTGHGAVSYEYRIGKYEVTNAQYVDFLNAVAATDTYELYNTYMSGEYGGITRSGSPGSYTYSTIAGRENMPVVEVDFYDTLRFANWLHNGQLTGAQDDSTTEDGAYTMIAESYPGGPFIVRNPWAKVLLPSEDEWYKAAYFNGTAYFDYPVGSDTQTTCALPGATPNTANCDFAVGNLTDVGSYTGSASPYGTFDQGGNVQEWNEGILGTSRVLRGGDYTPPNELSATDFSAYGPTSYAPYFGFRVASPAIIDWVTVGDPGNACETQSQGCFGAVAYTYQIGKYEVTNAQYVEFLNAVADTDSNGLYDTNMGSGYGGITRSGSPGSYTYSTIPGREEKPVIYVSFYDALRFANWLHNGQLTGAQDSSTTENGAYDMSLGISVVRKAGAKVFLTSEDEWYKAAYFNGTAYFAYPAGSNAQTTCALPGATSNTANCDNVVGNHTDAGSYTGSASPYGTFDQGGNVSEWNETLFLSWDRGRRGGDFYNWPDDLAASHRLTAFPAASNYLFGFRVARITGGASPGCGDGEIVGTEGCDDGNTDPGDGCHASCQIESGWTCGGEPSVCSENCGDETIVGTEECDDGGTEPGDGCDETCQVEPGWTCEGEPSVCTELPTPVPSISFGGLALLGGLVLVVAIGGLAVQRRRRAG